MIHNDVQYWRHLQSLPAGHEDLPTARVCRLLQRAMGRWKGKPSWPSEHHFGHLEDWLPVAEWDALRNEPIPIRKAHAIAMTLRRVADPTVAREAGSFRIDPDELVVGTMPPFSVGQGKEFVGYMTEAERLDAAIGFQSEAGPMGHIVPDHGTLLDLGLIGLLDRCRARLGQVGDGEPRCAEARAFLRSAIIALEGCLGFAESYALEADRLAERIADSDPRHSSLVEIAARLRRVPSGPARSFHDGVQAIHLLHCAFHWTQEIVPIGRLDLLLGDLLARDLESGSLDLVGAQEIVDCFWIKLDETAVLNPRHAEDRFGHADGPLTGQPPGPSNYDQGGLLNQWMQQITIGGVRPDDSPAPVDLSNDVTFLCLEAARRLPLNSPTLDLRVHRDSPDPLLLAAARCLLSGGAHPVLLNDDKIVPALMACGDVPLASARNYACDGCYETLFAGESEFAFGFVSAVEALERTLNRGATFTHSGPVHLRGLKGGFRCPPAEAMTSIEDLWSSLRSQILLGCHRYYRGVLHFYGLKHDWSPSPLLSAFIGGCIDSARDLSDGGARFHIFSPLMTGVSTAADSLFAIDELVYRRTEVGLDELVSCLRSDWGARPIAHGLHLDADRITEIRRHCDALPKFGTGQPMVDRLAWRLIDTFVACVREVEVHPCHAEDRRRLATRFGGPGRPFELLLAPGVGTFEQYIFGGTMCGATPDGRRAGTSIASDLSAAPIHADLDPVVETASGPRHARIAALDAALTSHAAAAFDALPDGAPADYNLPEDYPLADLTGILRRFANGEGGNVATFTVADPATLRNAVTDPENHNLVRVRMGGWSEFFVALFPDHQAQHRRRPLFVPAEEVADAR